MNEIISLWQLLEQGGWMMFPIYACSLLAMAVTLRKLVDFRRCRLSQTEWVETALDSIEAHDYDFAEQVCARTRHPAAAVVSGMVKALTKRPDRAQAEAERLGNEQIEGLERHLGLLAFVAEVAPLLGLLGTVVGMVDLFMTMQTTQTGVVAMAALSSGIWKALLTTAAGLAVAVPALAAHGYFTSRIDELHTFLARLVSNVLYVAPDPAEALELASDFRALELAAE